MNLPFLLAVFPSLAIAAEALFYSILRPTGLTMYTGDFHGNSLIRGGIMSIELKTDYDEVKVELCGGHFNYFKLTSGGAVTFMQQGETHEFVEGDAVIPVVIRDAEFDPKTVTFPKNCAQDEFIHLIQAKYPSAQFYPMAMHTETSLEEWQASLPTNSRLPRVPFVIGLVAVIALLLLNSTATPSS